MSLYRYSPPNAARDLCLHDGVGAPSQWVQRARLEVIGRALQGGTVQPGRRWDKQRGAPNPIRAVPFCATHQARNFSPRSPKVSSGSGLRSYDCGASNALSREQPRRALAPLGGSAGGRSGKTFGELELIWENHNRNPPPAPRGTFSFPAVGE